MIGSGPGVTSSLTIDIGVSSGVDNFCRFFGCGSTVEETLCLDRTGTGIVVRGFPRPGFSAGRIARSRDRIRHENWVSNADGCGGRMIPFHIRWRAHGGGTKVGFRIFHHV